MSLKNSAFSHRQTHGI